MTAPVTPSITSGRYAIDPGRSELRMRATHSFGLGPVAATFTLVDGAITIADDPAASSAQARVDAAGFRSDKARRDGDIRSARFLDVATHPEIAFVSTSVARAGDGWQLLGDLTVRGTTRPVTLELLAADAVDGGYRFQARTRVDRLAFGVGRRPVVGRYVDLELDVVAG